MANKPRPMKGFGLNTPPRPSKNPGASLGTVNPNPNLIGAIGSGNPAELLASIFDTVEIRSTVTPPIFINVASAADGTAQPNPLVRLLKPTLIMTGPGGRAVIAPSGEASDGTVMTALGIAALLGAGYALGKWL